MEEVEGYLQGERDYVKIEGGTGPLVYPAGFLYVFAILRFLTDEGMNIVRAQWIFLSLYVVQLLLVLWSYLRSRKVPVVWCLALILSKRVHSIYMLRMFNDCVAVLLGYMAVLLFAHKHWHVGSVCYSLAVSVKMNMLLYAPGIFLLYLLDIGVVGALQCISLCAIVQLVLGWPFLSTYPMSYLTKAFELSRIFMFKWTVNFKFLPEHVFVSKTLSIALLVATAIGELNTTD
jgi:alpha-1,3-mannosyltransferase